MKKVFLFLSLCLLVASFANDATAQQQKPRIYAQQATDSRKAAHFAGLSESGFRYGTGRNMASLPDGPWRWPRTGYKGIIRRLRQRSA